MARFRAYTTDSEDEEDEQIPTDGNKGKRPQDGGIRMPRDDEDTSDSGSSEGSPSPKQLRSRYAVRRQDVDEHETYSEEESSDTDAEARIASTSASPPPIQRPYTDPTMVPWARQLGVDAQKMHVMQTSLFRVPEEAAAMKRAQATTRVKLTGRNGLHRKHSRDSEGDGLRAESRQRSSFAHDIEPEPYRPSRKYARVDSSTSAVSGHEDVLVDSGLAFGRSFRVGWGPGGTLVHLGSLCGPSGTPKTTANSSIVTKTTVPIFSTSYEEASERTTKLLSHHLTNTPVEPDADGVPFANPPRHLSFSTFASLFPATDRSFEASLFRLGQALFDPVDLRLGDSIGVDIRNRISVLQRRTALSNWLQSAVASSVDADIRNDPAADWAAVVFLLLTGNQVEKACERAVDAGNVRLATLLSQGSGDDEFKEDLRTQLSLWREQRIDVHIHENVRKVYAVLAGIVDVLEGSKGTGLERCPDVQVAKSIDWKRGFGLHLWFGEPMDVPITSIYESYHRAEEAGTAAPPAPWYRESASQGRSQSLWKLPPIAQPPDAQYSLIRLFSDPACSLSDILTPLSFYPSPLDFRLSWHLYIILSRCLRARDFADRGDVGVDQQPEDGDQEAEPRVEGHSPSADLVANSYALQLEQLGMLQEAVFVLLHTEGSSGRARAIKELLCRCAPKLDDWMARGLVGSLKIPMTWVHEAKAVYAMYNGDVYGAYELYLAAGLYNAAHELAVLDLAPEAVIRGDIVLLKELFQKISGHPVEGWLEGGKAYLDYAHAMTRLPELRKRLEDEVDAVPDAAQAQELEDLTRSVPKLISILPSVLRNRTDRRHIAALAEMIDGLTLSLDQVRPLALQSRLVASLATQGTKLRHVHAAAYERFLRIIETA